MATEDDRIVEGGEMLAECSGEWDTEQLIRIDDEYYLRVSNGGYQGAWDRQCGDGVWRDYPVQPAREISRVEARKLLLDWNYSPAEVSKMTRENG